jgi:hypothetical protein
MAQFTRSSRAALLCSAAFLLITPPEAMAQQAPATAAAPATAGKRTYVPADFARFAPKNAYDMLAQVPGFIIRAAEVERGLGQASENVLLNGERISSKSGGAAAELQKIPAGNVERIEIVDAATLGIPGLSGQVANVFAVTKKASGQFSWTPEFRAHYSDPVFTRGEISYSGTKGRLDYTLGLTSNANRSAAGGPTTIYNPDSTVFENRSDQWHFNSNSPRFSGRFTLRGDGGRIGNLNLSYTPYWEDYFETSERDRIGDVDRMRRTRDKNPGFIYEVNGDYSFPLIGGTLKLIGLRRYEHEPYTSTAITEFADNRPDEGFRFSRDGKASEWIARSEYSWKAGAADWQISAEGAFNKLDSVTRLFSLDASGDFDELAFPGGTGAVEEDRYEVLLTHGRPLTDQLTLQVVAGGEYSKLGSSSDVASQSRSFFRPKGSISFAWKPSDDLDVSLKFRRRVGQLNFYDFLASVNLTSDTENAGNLDLVPPQYWEGDFEVNKKLGAWGTTRLRVYYRLWEDIVDIIPIGLTGESPGNIDKGKSWGLESRTTLLLDPIGFKGAKLDATLSFFGSRVRDPLTGRNRPFSGNGRRQFNLAFRHDIPGSDWAWGSTANHYYPEKTVRLTEVGRQWEGPWFVGVYAEHKDVAGLTVRTTFGNLLNARSYWDRLVYTGFRTTSPLDYREKRDRLIGPIFSLSVRGNF